MKFTFTEKKMDASADLRAYAERKVGKLDRLFKTESNAYLTFSTERGLPMPRAFRLSAANMRDLSCLQWARTRMS